MPRTIASNKSSDPEEQLRSFIEKFAPPHQAIIHAARKKLRKRFPTATEFAYDNYNFFVIGFAPNERPSDCIVTIAAAANGVGLCFVRGASLPDPEKVLLGSGKQTRFVRLPAANVLERPSGADTPVSCRRAREDAAAGQRLRQTCHSFRVSKAAASPQKTTKDLILVSA